MIDMTGRRPSRSLKHRASFPDGFEYEIRGRTDENVLFCVRLDDWANSREAGRVFNELVAEAEAGQRFCASALSIRLGVGVHDDRPKPEYGLLIEAELLRREVS